MHHLLGQDQKGGLARKTMQDALALRGSSLFSRQTSFKFSINLVLAYPIRALAESD